MKSMEDTIELVNRGQLSRQLNDPCRIYWHAGTPMERTVVNQLRCFFTEIWVSTVIHNSIHCGLTLGRLWIHSKPLWKFSQPIHRHFHSMEKSMDPCGFAILYVKTTSYQSPFHSPMEIYFYQAMEVASWGYKSSSGNCLRLTPAF